ncbi:MAG TPA: sugar phosphate isomerase/epimerase family protein [Clostridia bacterium]|nr:sugar phosphate isomerase/epimerase family protein [Clostridia bacterium]
MKKGLNAWTFPNETPMERRMELAAKAGYDGFECLYEVEGYVGMNQPDGQLKQVRARAKDLGLEIPSLVGAHYEGLSIADGDSKRAAEARERVKRMLHAAGVLGADTVLLVAGRCASTREDPDAQYDRVYDNALKSVALLAETARDEGVRIGIEPVWSKFLLSPIEFRAFVDAAASPWVGAYFDTGNVMIWGYPEQWIRILGKRLYKCHFKDFRRSVGTGGGFVDLLAGDVDFPEVMAAFREIGYDGYCICEVSPYQFDPEFMAIQTAGAMDRIFTM